MIHNFRPPRDSITAVNPLVDRLLRLPLFAGLDRGALARITAGAEEVSLPGGTVIYRRGDPCKGLYIVVTGQVKLALHASHGAEKVVELVGPGACIGETTIARGCPHVLTAETITETRLIHLSKAAAQEELARTPVFARGLISSLSDRMHHLISAFENCMLRSGTERVVRYLMNRLPAEAGEQGRNDRARGQERRDCLPAQSYAGALFADFARADVERPDRGQWPERERSGHRATGGARCRRRAGKALAQEVAPVRPRRRRVNGLRCRW